jgi:hypothetical protein
MLTDMAFIMRAIDGVNSRFGLETFAMDRAVEDEGAVMPSSRSAAMNGVVLHCPCGTLAESR